MIDDTVKRWLRDFLSDAEHYEARATALESDAAELRRKAEYARKGAEYLDKSTRRK